MAAFLKLLTAMFGNSRTTILSRLAVIATLIGTAFVEFASHDPALVKGPIGAAAIGLVTVWLNAEHVTVRNADTAAATVAAARGASSNTAAAVTGGVDLGGLLDAIVPKPKSPTATPAPERGTSAT